MTEQASEGNQPVSGVPGIETAVQPHTVYVADDPVRPRWRFGFVVQSRSGTDLEVVEFRIQYRADPSGPWLQAPTPGRPWQGSRPGRPWQGSRLDMRHSA